MKVNKIDLQNTIEEIIANGVAHCEEIDLTTKKVMVCIEPLMLAVQNLSSKSENQRLKTEREWISVNDRLPKDNETVLVTNGKRVKEVWFGQRTKLDRPHFMFTTMPLHTITHWMPLPEPPKQ